MIYLLVLACLTQVGQNAYADTDISDLVDIRFGPEFTFEAPTDNYDREQLKQAIIKHLENHLIENQPEAARFTQETYSFKSPNFWSFRLDTDPGVFEVTMTPKSVGQFTKYKDDMQDAIFTSFMNQGSFVQLYQGGGHINIDAKPLLKRPLLFRNFIVDFINHSELSMGAFNYDTNNALPISMLSKESWLKLTAVIAEFDELENPKTKDSIDLKSAINKILNNSYDQYRRYWVAFHGNRHKHTALYLGNIDNNPKNHESRIEIRAFRPQTSMDVWVRQIRLLRNRLLYLDNLQGPIELKPLLLKHSSISGEATVEQALTSPIDPQRALKNFYTYVTESGEKWDDHKDYLWPQWHTDGEIEKFENSDWFLSQTCEGLLKAN